MARRIYGICDKVSDVSRGSASLFWEALKGDIIAIAAGSLDEGAGVRLAAHIFEAGKGDDYDLADGLPQFPQSGDNVPRPD